MVAISSFIETGVDRLMNLIKSKEKISVPDAAKKLGVSTTTVEEWAEFLEEEGIIDMEYKLATPYMSERRLTKKEIKKKETEFYGKKDMFVSKAESMLSSLDKEATGLRKVKGEFDKMKKELGFEVDTVKEELAELEKYEQLKREIDAEALEQRKETEIKFRDMNEQILREQKKYRDLLEEIDEEEEKLNEEKAEAYSLEETERMLKQRLADLKESIPKIEDKLGMEDAQITSSEKRIEALKSLVNNIKAAIGSEKEKLLPLIEQSRKQEKKILDLQNQVVQKTSEKGEKLKKAKEVVGNFKKFFNEKMKTEELISKVNKDRDILEKELVILIRKAKSFQLSSSKNLGEHIAALENKFKDIDEKKGSFESELRELSSLLKKKE